MSDQEQTDRTADGPPSAPERETAEKEASSSRESAIEWRDDAMRSDFANVVNIQGTREQIDLFFGVNRTWNYKGDGPMQVDLTNRVILTPLAAKRMWSILTNVLREHEKRYGALKIDN